MMTRAQIKTFVMAGNAHFTIKSRKTNKHYTFIVQLAMSFGKPVQPQRHLVKVLTGPDNVANYTLIGRIDSRGVFNARWDSFHGSPLSAHAFWWFWESLRRGLSEERFHSQCQFSHVGRCGRCNRLLTVPSSIESGIGPECQDKLDFEAAGGVDGLMNQLFGGG